MLEVGISREDCPAAIQRNRADESIHDRDSHAPALALVAGLSRPFKIRSIGGYVGKGAEHRAKCPKLRWSSNAGKNFLPY